MKKTFLFGRCQPAWMPACAKMLLILFSSLATAAPPEVPEQRAAVIDAREQLRHQERERALQRQNRPQTDERLPRIAKPLRDYPTDERPCFLIHRLSLVGESAERFQWALAAAADTQGRCLGAQGIVLAINKVQNAILAKEYVTSRVMAQEQDLTKGVLMLTLQPGRINAIRD